MREQADITIQELSLQGFVGILPGKDAVVLVREQFDPVLYLSDWFDEFLNKMHVNARSSVEMGPDGVEVRISGHNLGALIGRRGQTLDSLQYLATLVLNKKTADFVPVFVDVGDYREKRRQAVEKTALAGADKVIRTGRKFILPPMTPAERRLVHMALSDKDVVTYSIGEEPRRKVVIDVKRD